MTCEKCGGAGWVYWYELEGYDGPASDISNCYSDNTRYTCDLCQGIKEDTEIINALQEVIDILDKAKYIGNPVHVIDKLITRR